MNANRLILFAMVLIMVNPLLVHAEGIVTIGDDVDTDFGVYNPVTVDVAPAVPVYDIADDLSNVVNAGDFEFSEDARDKLTANGFVCTASRYGQLYDIYNYDIDGRIPVFVTTDACLHTYHVLYDYTLRILETEHFSDDLIDLTDAMIERTSGIHDSAAEPSVRQAALDAAAYFLVAMSLLAPERLGEYAVYDSVAAAVTAETDNILALSDGYVESPLFHTTSYPYLEDYSQYRPRGHYTRSEGLERYFRAMTWFGRITFSLELMGASAEGLRQTAREAIIISLALSDTSMGAKTAETVWERIYQPTVFFVGKSDDIIYSDYRSIARTVFPDDPAENIDILAGDEHVDAFIDEARDTLPDPSITVAAGKGFRFMGQRFVPDSYVFDRLVFQERQMPRGLDIMAVLGSERAYEIIDTVYGDTMYQPYVEGLSLLREEFSGYGPGVWAYNLYYNWLYTLVPLLEPKGEGYPLFMQNPAWLDKDLNTALGSWAELRHDTILYAKQSETPIVETPTVPMVKGYVEPNPGVYARLAALSGYMRRGLDERGLLNTDIGERLETFESLMLDVKDIAVKELRNIPPTTDEFLRINRFGPAIERVTSFPAATGGGENESDDLMAVIADVHTDPNGNTALEVGVGYPLNIFVVVPVGGDLVIARGGVFSYHEFSRSLADGRLTDEEWQQMQRGDGAVSMPEWTAGFTSGMTSPGEPPVHHLTMTRVTGVEDTPSPETFALSRCYPNPFNPVTTISFTLPESGHTTLAVYSVTGQLVAVLRDGYMEAGTHNVPFNGQGLASGVYFYWLESMGRHETGKMILMK